MMAKKKVSLSAGRKDAQRAVNSAVWMVAQRAVNSVFAFPEKLVDGWVAYSEVLTAVDLAERKAGHSDRKTVGGKAGQSVVDWAACLGTPSAAWSADRMVVTRAVRMVCWTVVTMAGDSAVK